MSIARLRFQDGGEVALTVPAGTTIAEAALEAGAPLRSDCLSGTCGSCVARCVSGSPLQDVLPGDVVSADEIAAGLYPTCLARLDADASFELDYPLTPRPSEPARHAAQVVAIDRLAASVSRVILELDHASAFHFQPGQYVRFRPPGVRAARAYSIASTPADLPRIELLIRHVPGGQVSGWLDSAPEAGGRATLHGPLGGFALDDRGSRAVFVAGGTGLAPALSMIRAHVGRMPMLLCFGCTRREEMFLHDELSALAAEHPCLEVRIALGEGAEGAIRQGTAVALLAGEPTEGARYHLCGPPGMVNAASALLRGEGIAGEYIRTERFALRG
jgi:benzoate/toluate 1,2-dioxygenase reductase subunit